MIECAFENYLAGFRAYPVAIPKRLDIQIPTVVNKKVPVNACGFSAIPALNRAEGFTAIDRVTINGSTPYTPTTLPLVPNAPQCVNGTIYTPQ